MILDDYDDVLHPCTIMMTDYFCYYPSLSVFLPVRCEGLTVCERLPFLSHLGPVVRLITRGDAASVSDLLTIQAMI